MQSQIPITRAHLQYDTGARRRELERWLDELVVEGVLEVDVGEGGEMIYTVPGADRPSDGPRTFAELEKRRGGRKRSREKKRSREADPDPGEDLVLASKAMSLANRARSSLDKPKEKGEKSLLLSAGLSFFGPLGWLYAAPFRESLPAIGAMMLLWSIVPSFLLSPLLFLLLPLSSVAGLVYGWQYNRYGERTPIFLSDGKDDEEK